MIKLSSYSLFILVAFSLFGCGNVFNGVIDTEYTPDILILTLFTVAASPIHIVPLLQPMMADTYWGQMTAMVIIPRIYGLPISVTRE